jgi:hypothetical protein
MDHIRRYNTPPGTLVLRGHGAGKLVLPSTSSDRLDGIATPTPDFAEISGA